MGNIGGGRPLRVCDLCGGVDDHPRHTIVGTVAGVDLIPAPSDDIINRVLDQAPPADRARLMRDLTDTSSTERHLDCCRTAGCPEPADSPNNCANRTGGAEDLRGARLLGHLETQMEG